MKKIILNSLLVIVAIVFASCSSDDDNNSSNPTSNTIADFVNENPSYSTLKSALDLTSLTPALSSSTEFTVFAPDNDSFESFLSSNGFSSLDDVPLEVLEQVLLNHVIQGVNASSSLSWLSTTVACGSEAKGSVARQTKGQALLIFSDFIFSPLGVEMKISLN